MLLQGALSTHAMTETRNGHSSRTAPCYIVLVPFSVVPCYALMCLWMVVLLDLAFIY